MLWKKDSHKASNVITQVPPGQVMHRICHLSTSLTSDGVIYSHDYTCHQHKRTGQHVLLLEVCSVLVSVVYVVRLLQSKVLGPSHN